MVDLEIKDHEGLEMLKVVVKRTKRTGSSSLGSRGFSANGDE